MVVSACGGLASTTDDPVDQGLADNADLIEIGSELYAANCAACHGVDLRGTDRGPSHLSVVYEPNHHGDFAFQLAIQQGVRSHHWPFGDMPPIAGLDDSEINSIVAFVREVQRVEGFDPYPPS